MKTQTSQQALSPHAREVIDELRDLLQQAHFAARRLEGYVPPSAEDRLADSIHSIRRRLEHLDAGLLAAA